MSRADLFPSLYFKDWKNAERFKPNSTPPRLNFNGFVEFVFNPSVIEALQQDGLAFRTQISSLVQTADLPSVNFNVETKNQYNIKRVVNTGVTFSSVNINVIDTISNEWLLVFMKYFSFLYMQPRNKTTTGFGSNRDTAPRNYQSNSDTLTRPSGFMKDTFESNAAGLNLNYDSNFFDTIKLVTYAGGKGVEYILFKPVLTDFKPGNIDYTNSGFRQFSLSFEYENFTINEKVNFNLNREDKARFESYNGLFVTDLTDFVEKQTYFGYKTKDLRNVLGTPSDTLNRTAQPVYTGNDIDSSTITKSATGDTVAGAANVKE